MSASVRRGARGKRLAAIAQHEAVEPLGAGEAKAARQRRIVLDQAEMRRAAVPRGATTRQSSSSIASGSRPAAADSISRSSSSGQSARAMPSSGSKVDAERVGRARADSLLQSMRRRRSTRGRRRRRRRPPALRRRRSRRRETAGARSRFPGRDPAAMLAPAVAVPQGSAEAPARAKRRAAARRRRARTPYPIPHPAGTRY